MRITIGLFLLFGLITDGMTDDFRSLPWGTSMDDIIEAEGEPSVTEKDCVRYTDSAAERPAVVIYCADENEGLYRGTYQFTVAHGTAYRRYLDDFSDVQTRLTARYGEPTAAGAQWSDPRLRGPRTHWPFRLAEGALSLRAEWRLEDCHIIQVLEKDIDGNGLIRHFVRYENPTAHRVMLGRDL